MEDKQNNLIRKRIRLSRKCKLQEFNYFVTFTYDDKLHTEQSFKTSIMRCLRHLCERKGWRYLGVWERGGKNERLYYHALLYVPENTMRERYLKRTILTSNAIRAKPLRRTPISWLTSGGVSSMKFIICGNRRTVFAIL